MTTAGSTIGSRVKIVDMLHSPARTRAFASWLVGQRGKVVSILRNGTLALVEVDGEPSELLGGVRRWPVHWDDLLVYTVDAGPVDFEEGYRLGLSGLTSDAVQHAVRYGSRTSLREASPSTADLWLVFAILTRASLGMRELCPLGKSGVIGQTVIAMVLHAIGGQYAPTECDRHGCLAWVEQPDHPF
jgi:hypothetical protein